MTCIQLGIEPSFDRLIVSRRRERRRRKLAQWAVWRVVELMYRAGFTDRVIAWVVGRNPHHIYVMRRRMGWKKYRDDHYVRPARKAA